MDKKLILNLSCAVLFLATLFVIIWGKTQGLNRFRTNYTDGIEQVDLDTIYLDSSGVEVNFSDVLLSNQNETRKLIVSEQTGTVSTQLTDRIINKLDFDFLKKTQKVTYTGTGYFVVDLDNLTQQNITEDRKNKTVTIRIGHAYLQTVDIDPNKILIDEVKESLFARGNIELSVSDYNSIEKELRTRLEETLNTAANGQKADEIALEMVKEVFEPVIKAIDRNYSVVVVFK